jgi:hypothetical protein
MRCQYCRMVFQPKHPRGRFCGPTCRIAAWQAAREARLAEAEAAVAHALELLRRLGRVRR